MLWYVLWYDKTRDKATVTVYLFPYLCFFEYTEIKSVE